MPPEQWEGKAVPASDLYAIAMVIYRRSPAAMHSGTDPAAGTGAGFAAAAAVLRRGLALDPAARWPDAQTFRAALSATRRPHPALRIGVPSVAVAGAAVVVAVVIWGGAGGSDVAVLPFEVTGGPADIGEHLAIVVQKNLENAWATRDSG